MKVPAFLFVGLSLALLTSGAIIETLSKIDEITEGELCHGIEDVDLSEFNLGQNDLDKLMSKTLEDVAIQELQEVEYLETENTSEDDEDDSGKTIKISVRENGLGAVRKVIVTPDHKKVYSKTMKTSETTGEFTTSVSPPSNSSYSVETDGNAKFEVEIDAFGERPEPHRNVIGEVQVSSNSTTKWVKKHRVNVLKTDTTSCSKGKISYAALENGSSDEKLMLDMEISSDVHGNSDTVFLSKKCLASKTSSSFETELGSSDWKVNVDGKGRGGAYSHIFYADKNGSSVSWTFVKMTVSSKIKADVGNTSFTGSQYTKIRVFTETVTKPLLNLSTTNSMAVQVSNEIRIGVDTKSSLDNGYKIFSKGGQLLFRNTILQLPGINGIELIENGGLDNSLGNSHTSQEIVLGLVRKQGEAENIMTLPFVNSIMASLE